MSVTPDVTRRIVGQQIADWQAQFENLRIASIVAEAIGDKERKPELEAALRDVSRLWSSCRQCY